MCTREVLLADQDESTAEATRRMRSNNVGTLVVIDRDDRRPLGLITDRDIAMRVVAEGKHPDETLVREILTDDPITVVESTPIEDALARMRSDGRRRVLVTGEDGALVGLLAMDDILELLAEEMAEIGELIERQEPLLRRWSNQ
jgi:predicted transcriptional regulator